MIIGVTGSFGTGKTTVAGLFKKLGAKVIDADKLSHALLRPGSLVYKKILKTFGAKILSGNSIDRHKLSKIVFNNPASLRRLCAIIHPAVTRQIGLKLKANKPRQLIVIDAPLLLEVGLIRHLDFLIVVKTNRANQIKRIQAVFKLSRRDILKRIRAQMPLQAKVRLADFVIDNNASLRETKLQVRKIYRIIKGG